MKKYKIIYADPPWSYQDKGCNGNCASHYKTMSIQDICNLPLGGYAMKIVFCSYGLLTRCYKRQ